jgi:hypothetical protein
MVMEFIDDLMICCMKTRAWASIPNELPLVDWKNRSSLLPNIDNYWTSPLNLYPYLPQLHSGTSQPTPSPLPCPHVFLSHWIIGSLDRLTILAASKVQLHDMSSCVVLASGQNGGSRGQA